LRTRRRNNAAASMPTAGSRSCLTLRSEFRTRRLWLTSEASLPVGREVYWTGAVVS